jgi:hypothetical protein
VQLQELVWTLIEMICLIRLFLPPPPPSLEGYHEMFFSSWICETPRGTRSLLPLPLLPIIMFACMWVKQKTSEGLSQRGAQRIRRPQRRKQDSRIYAHLPCGSSLRTLSSFSGSCSLFPRTFGPRGAQRFYLCKSVKPSIKFITTIFLFPISLYLMIQTSSSFLG